MLLMKGDIVLRDGGERMAEEGERDLLRGLREEEDEDEAEAEEGPFEGDVRWAEEIISLLLLEEGPDSRRKDEMRKMEVGSGRL